MYRRCVALTLAATALVGCGGQDADDQTVGGSAPADASSTTTAPPAPATATEEELLLTVSVPLPELQAALSDVEGARVLREAGDGQVVVAAPLAALPDLARVPGVERAEVVG